jgi:hypothetical protein
MRRSIILAALATALAVGRAAAEADNPVVANGCEVRSPPSGESAYDHDLTADARRRFTLPLPDGFFIGYGWGEVDSAEFPVCRANVRYLTIYVGNFPWSSGREDDFGVGEPGRVVLAPDRRRRAHLVAENGAERVAEYLLLTSQADVAGGVDAAGVAHLPGWPRYVLVIVEDVPADLTPRAQALAAAVQAW